MDQSGSFRNRLATREPSIEVEGRPWNAEALRRAAHRQMGLLAELDDLQFFASRISHATGPPHPRLRLAGAGLSPLPHVNHEISTDQTRDLRAKNDISRSGPTKRLCPAQLVKLMFTIKRRPGATARPAQGPHRNHSPSPVRGSRRLCSIPKCWSLIRLIRWSWIFEEITNNSSYTRG